MKCLCVHLYHDSNICLYDSEEKTYTYLKSERICGLKHSNDQLPIINLIKSVNFKPDFLVIVYGDIEGFKVKQLYGEYENINELRKHAFSIAEKHKWRKLSREYFILFEKLKFLNVPIHWVQHDYAHILSGWTENIKFDYGISLDGGGPDLNHKLIVKNPFDLDNHEILFSSSCWHEKTFSNLGKMFTELGLMMSLKGDSLDFAGKIMGLQAYGKPNKKILDDFKKKNDLDFKIISFLFNSFQKLNDKKFYFENQEFLNFICTMHEAWKENVLFIFNKFINKNSSVVYSGGCAQNTVVNKYILDHYPNLKVIPHCYDGGLSLGLLAFFILKNKLNFPENKNFPYVQTDEKPSNEANIRTIKKIAKLLAKGKIIGWYQGNGEIGPRALGNRSILMNPSILNGKEILNSKVKHREHWRPYAPSVLQEFSNDWFNISNSKHMMFAAEVKKDKKKLIPSVTHKDGTSRVQTVTKEDNELFYSLIREFYNLTKTPMILNTSLNKGGGPIVGSPKQAKDFYLQSNLDAICIGNKIYNKIKLI